MALVQIADVIIPEVFADYVLVQSVELSAWVQSGVIVQDPFLDAFLAGGGRLETLPFYDDLGDNLANISTDEAVGVNDAVPLKITTDKQVVIRQNRNQVWSAADLVSALVGNDPLSVISSRVAAYWVRQEQLRIIATTQGVIQDSIDNDGEDMIHDIAEPTTAVLAANRFSAEAVIDTVQTMGDHGESMLGAIVMHSVIYARAKKNNLIDFVSDSANPHAASIPFFNGLRVLVDDGMPINTGGTNDIYSTYIFGQGAFRQGESPPRVPAEVTREALAGDGGGQEYLSSRQQRVVHPWGMRFTDTTVAIEAPTNAELALPANWIKAVDRKLIPIAELRTNS